MKEFKTIETDTEMFKYDIEDLSTEQIYDIDMILAKASNDIDDIRFKEYYKTLNVRKEDGTVKEELIHVDLIKEFYKLEPIRTVAREFNPDVPIVLSTIKYIHKCELDDETMNIIKQMI